MPSFDNLLDASRCRDTDEIIVVKYFIIVKYCPY